MVQIHTLNPADIALYALSVTHWPRQPALSGSTNSGKNQVRELRGVNLPYPRPRYCTLALFEL